MFKKSKLKIKSTTIILYFLEGQVHQDSKGPDDGRSISRNVAYLNIIVHGVINLLYYLQLFS